jgi:hypothetical protein
MATFLALYQGRTVGQAQMVAVCTDPDLVSLVAAKLLENSHKEEEAEDDPVSSALNSGRRQALQIIKGGKE